MNAGSADVRQQAQSLLAAVPLVERIGEIDARLDSLEAERKTLRGALPKGEAGDRIAAWIRKRRESFAAEWGRTLIGQVSHEPSRPGERAEPRLPVANHEIFDFVLWLLGPDLKATAREAVERLTYQEGASSAQRSQNRTALETERARLVAEREQLVDEAREAGAAVEHIDETARARRQAAEQERRLAEAQAEQEKALQGVDAAHERVDDRRKSRAVVLGQERRTAPARLG